MTDGSTIRLADLCDLVAEQVDPRGRPDDVYVGLEHVASGRFLRAGQGKAADVRSAKSAFQPGDVLYGKLRPYLDKAVLAEDAGICTTELLVLRAKEGVAPRFLVGVVHFPEFVEYAVSGITGAHHPRTSWAHIREFRLPASVRDEQEKIAELLWLVHGTITACEASIEAGRALKRAAMRKLFTGGLRGEARKKTEIGPMPQSWIMRPIGEYAQQMQYGLSIRGASQGRYPILRMNCQQDGKVLLRDLQYVDIDDKTINAYRVRPNDILFNRTNSFELVGRTAIVEFDMDIVFASYLVRISVHGGQLNAHFLNHFLNWETAQHELKKLASRGVGQANISAGKLKGFSVPIPKINEQREIVAILEAIDRKIGLHRRKRAVLDDLFKTLLHKLMTGAIRVADLDLSAIEPVQSNT